MWQKGHGGSADRLVSTPRKVDSSFLAFLFILRFLPNLSCPRISVLYVLTGMSTVARSRDGFDSGELERPFPIGYM